ncbi:translation initiation factor IF-3 [Brumimicrobium aurantiacum]|uniref:Translation initiation factor IF-3 n=1 Tax=Brumimicrobium aurantiacum TaxID=1737063 RepID=A0A3E1EW19_9FLAO|nr:translation initiation factor IF-3 [Brumimicrobium aurantiacum]RFC53718.1 translation initiation factor IF-3 [Brumimicrobium aurantiacum]
MRRPRRNFKPRQEDPNRINDRIRVPQIRLVGDGQEPQIMDTKDALKLADEQDLDLVEISPKAKPPVCKIMDYKKFLYNQKKREKELKAKQSKVTIKEIRFGPNTEEHDFNFKLDHAKKFLQEGAKVKAFVFFRGRTIVFKDRGEILLLRFAQELSEYGTLELMPKLEGKRMTIMINPKKD